MNYRRLTVLIMIVSSSFLGNACSKTNLAVPAAPMVPMVTLGGKQSEDTRPLYFVNNTEVKNFKQVGPNDIESINVVKSSATNDLVSTYGPRAKNGIIFVTMKKGK